MNGVINLDKPAGLSSARAVSLVKRLLPKGTKIGHAGTLDPFATGVLLLLVGKATKSCERLMGQPKQYDATLKLGATTPTDDPESPETPTPGVHDPLPPESIRRALPQFVGAIQQKPPVFSAMKLAGRRAYDLARRGQPVALEPRTVQVYSIELIRYDWPLLELRIECGRGTYIRSIARDLGEALGTGAYLTTLRRTRIGTFNVADSVNLDTLRSTGVTPHLLPPPSSTDPNSPTNMDRV